VQTANVGRELLLFQPYSRLARTWSHYQRGFHVDGRVKHGHDVGAGAIEPASTVPFRRAYNPTTAPLPTTTRSRLATKCL